MPGLEEAVVVVSMKVEVEVVKVSRVDFQQYCA